MIDAAFTENDDPLAAAREEKDFEKLFTRIVTLAPPPPIGVGPAAGQARPSALETAKGSP